MSCAGCASVWPSLGLGGALKPTPPPSITDTADPDILREALSPAGSTRVVGLVFDIVRLDFPVDDLHHSRKIWNHVDELRIGADMVSRLARNSLRVGVGSTSAWPAIQAIVQAAKATARRQTVVPQQGVPASIRVGSIHGEESIFSYGADGRLAGRTFLTGDKFLTIDYAYRPRLTGSTDLKLTLEIRHDRGEMTWERSGGVIREVPAIDRRIYGDLAASFTLNLDEFAVLGSHDAAGNGNLIGNRFFTAAESSSRVETILVITPRVFQRTVANKPSS